MILSYFQSGWASRLPDGGFPRWPRSKPVTRDGPCAAGPLSAPPPRSRPDSCSSPISTIPPCARLAPLVNHFAVLLSVPSTRFVSSDSLSSRGTSGGRVGEGGPFPSTINSPAINQFPILFPSCPKSLCSLWLNFNFQLSKFLLFRPSTINSPAINQFPILSSCPKFSPPFAPFAHVKTCSLPSFASYPKPPLVKIRVLSVFNLWFKLRFFVPLLFNPAQGHFGT